MRILLINHFPLEGSGSGIYTKNVAKRLTERGHEVEVIVVDKYKNRGDGFKVRTILNYNFPCFTTHPHSNNQFYHLTNDEMDDYLNSFISTIEQEVKSFNPDIIHCQHIWVAPYATSKTSIPYIITAHGTDIKGFKKDKRYHQIALQAAENAKKIVTISEYINQSVKKHFPVDDDKLKIILNGFDEEIFKPMNLNKIKVLQKYIDTDLKNKKDLKVINFTGKLTNFKGVDLLLKAANIYEDEFEDIITLIVGDGELKNELIELRDDLGLKEVHFLGNLPQATLSELYNIADLTVVPSRIEPFGLVAIESLACGTPVIASRAGGLKDFINEDVGRFFTMDDYKELAVKVIEAIVKDEKQKKGKKASDYAINNYSWNRVIDELIDVYDGIIEEVKS
ncbi:MAG: glycosyltransferase family 4 protein [Halanaerobiales bacterium]|nr:glycosyltransferase family 4 protein [Halanaerobiales bacterium]HKL41869.1 glycosyltransferase family 4 protein [Clostridia bacterium]